MATKKGPNPNPVNSIFARGGTTKGLNLLVVKYDNATHSYNDKEGNAKNVHFLDAQTLEIGGVNEGKIKPQLNPHLFSQKENDPQYEGRYNTQVPYYDNQFEAIKEAAGDSAFPVNDKNGNQIGTAYAVNADVMFRNREVDGKKVSNGAALNYKTLGPVSEDIAKTLQEAEANGGVVKAQFEQVAATGAEFKAQRAAKENQAEVPQAETPQAEAPQAEAAEPEFG